MSLSDRGVATLKPLAAPAVSSFTINFSSTSHVIDAVKTFGYCISGYGGDDGDIRTSTTIQGLQRTVAGGILRLGLKWDSTNQYPLNGSAYATGTGDDWIAGINTFKMTGGQIVGIIEGEIVINGTTYRETACTPADAASIVHYYNDNGGQHGGPIKYWVIGNEPDLVGADKLDYQGRDMHDGRLYGNTWLQIYAAMKAADSTILIGGPTGSQFYGHVQTTIANATSPGAITQFWNDYLSSSISGTGMVADLADFIDVHYYGTGTTAQTISQVLSDITVGSYETSNIRTLINAYATGGTRGSTIPVIFSEFNWSYRGNDNSTDLTDDYGVGMDGKFIMAANTVFIASMYLNLISQSGWGMMYSDLNGPLGLMTTQASADVINLSGVLHHYPHGKPIDTPYPAYFGLGMWTGMGLFRRFGANISPISGTSVANLQLMASNTTNDVVIANQDVAIRRNLTLTLTGIANGTSVKVWSTNQFAPWDPPKLTATMTVVSGQIAGLIVLPLSVVRLVIG